VVGSCGGVGWRKGADLFLQIARIVCGTPGLEDVRFLWVGGEVRDKGTMEFEHDLRALQLQDRCVRIPTTASVLDYYAAMDVFALTSREDPFPLVMLEAAAQSVPTVCFAGSGGGPEFVSADAGLVAPYLDAAAFAALLLKLRSDPALRQRLGRAALQKVKTCYSLESQAPKLAAVLEKCLIA